VQAARQLLARKGRRAAGEFLVEGPHAIESALAAGASVRELFLRHDAAADHAEIAAAAAAQGAVVRLAGERVLDRLTDTVTPQGAVAVVGTPAAGLDDVLAIGPRLVCVLPAVADPGNLGTIVRSADAAGADAVIVGEGSADVWSGKAVRASAGSVFHIPIVTDGAPLDVLPRLRSAGITVIAATADGDDDLDVLVDRGELAAPTAWMFGNEAHGLPEDLRGAADRRVRIPIHGRAESLNLAAAAVLCLYASARGHRAVMGADRQHPRP